MIENQTRDDLVRFNGDFGRVMVKMYIKKCGRRRGVKSEKNMNVNSFKTAPIYSRTIAMSIHERI